MKDKALLLLIFIVMKRSSELKTCRCANGSYQRIYSKKHENLLPTPDFYAFKYICIVITKESKDVATVDLLGFFL